jgi:hypothetical protein
MCGPRGLPGESDHLFHNNGDGTFTDVSVKAGVSDPRGYYGLASVFVDVDDDGWLDLLVANDSVPKYLYRNKHDGTFEDVSYLSGFALNDEGREQAAMGIAVGDYNRDGRVDFHITNFSDDYNTLYRNDGDASFSDVSFAAGIGNVTIPFLGWGTGFLDFDNDGLLDIFVANGHVYPGVDKQDWGTTFAQRPLLFRNLNGTKFEEVPPTSSTTRTTGLGFAWLGAQKAHAMQSVLRSSSRQERSASAATFSAAAVTPPVPIRAYTSAWVQQPKWTRWKSSGRAGQEKRFESHRWTGFSP